MNAGLRAPPAEHVAEDIAEDVLHIDEAGRIKPASTAAIARNTRVPKAVIARALFRVRQNRVSLAALFELLFRIGVIWIAVRMILHRQLAVGALEFLLRGRAAYAQDLVIIAFYVGSQIYFLALGHDFSRADQSPILVIPRRL